MAWFAADASKAWAEKFFLICNTATLALFLAVFITAGLYKRFDDRDSYAVVAALLALPNVVVPFFLNGAADRAVPWTRRFVAKANVWNLIFGFIGNYFWTHYFYTMLGAKYTFDTYNLNGVPVPCYLATHAYFVFYHSISSVVLRRARVATKGLNRHLGSAVFAGAVLVLAYVTALMETVTISAFPYYDFENRADMYKYGTFLYAIYFIVSFPMYLRIDENVTAKRWSLAEVALDSFAASMIVTQLLDFWRLFIGPITQLTWGSARSQIPFVG